MYRYFYFYYPLHLLKLMHTLLFSEFRKSFFFIQAILWNNETEKSWMFTDDLWCSFHLVFIEDMSCIDNISSTKCKILQRILFYFFTAYHCSIRWFWVWFFCLFFFLCGRWILVSDTCSRCCYCLGKIQISECCIVHNSTRWLILTSSSWKFCSDGVEVC